MSNVGYIFMISTGQLVQGLGCGQGVRPHHQDLDEVARTNKIAKFEQHSVSIGLFL